MFRMGGAPSVTRAENLFLIGNEADPVNGAAQSSLIRQFNGFFSMESVDVTGNTGFLVSLAK